MRVTGPNFEPVECVVYLRLYNDGTLYHNMIWILHSGGLGGGGGENCGGIARAGIWLTPFLGVETPVT